MGNHYMLSALWMFRKLNTVYAHHCLVIADTYTPQKSYAESYPTRGCLLNLPDVSLVESQYNIFHILHILTFGSIS